MHVLLQIQIHKASLYQFLGAKQSNKDQLGVPADVMSLPPVVLKYLMTIKS